MKPEPINFEGMKADIQKIGDSLVQAYLQKEECKTYNEAKSNDIIHSITEECISQMSAMYKSYKFTATCTLLNIKEGGLHMASSCYWDNVTDGNVVIRSSNDILCLILNIFALH